MSPSPPGGAPDPLDERLAANRAAWDARVPVHAASRFYDVEGRLRDKQGPHPWELEALGDVSGLRLLHLQCHFGLDTLAWARAGADVVGLDFSPNGIETARSLAERAGLSDKARFVCADVYDAQRALEGATFDVVYVSTGALCWLPNVDRWARVVGSLVAPGGRLYLHDGHPMSWALADAELAVEHTYFEEDEPFVDDSGATYTDAPEPLPPRRMYEWNHGLGETVTALIRHGLQLAWLREDDWAVWPRFPWLVETEDGRWVIPPGMPRVPLQYRLLATRAPSERHGNDLPKPSTGRRSRSYRAVLMANVFTAVPPQSPPPLSGAARSVLPLADLFMVAMWSRPATGSLDKTWVTPATLLLAAACVAGVVVLLVALVAGAVHWPPAVGAIVAIACTALGVGAASVLTVGLDQRRKIR